MEKILWIVLIVVAWSFVGLIFALILGNLVRDLSCDSPKHDKKDDTKERDSSEEVTQKMEIKPNENTKPTNTIKH